MDGEQDCGCHEHGRHHGAPFEGWWGGHTGFRGCGGHGGHGMYGGWRHGGFGECGCQRHHSGSGFHRRFISREECIAGLEEYLKQLQAEAKGVEEFLAELKKAESPQS